MILTVGSEFGRLSGVVFLLVSCWRGSEATPVSCGESLSLVGTELPGSVEMGVSGEAGEKTGAELLLVEEGVHGWNTGEYPPRLSGVEGTSSEPVSPLTRSKPSIYVDQKKT